MLQKRDKSSVLLNRSHVGLQSEELREEEPKSSTQHEDDRQRTGDNRRNVQKSGESLLRNNLDRQTEAMEEEESGNALGRGGSGHVEEYQLVHHGGDDERRHHRRNGSPFPADEPGGEGEGG